MVVVKHLVAMEIGLAFECATAPMAHVAGTLPADIVENPVDIAPRSLLRILWG